MKEFDIAEYMLFIYFYYYKRIISVGNLGLIMPKVICAYLFIVISLVHPKFWNWTIEKMLKTVTKVLIIRIKIIKIEVKLET